MFTTCFFLFIEKIRNENIKKREGKKLIAKAIIPFHYFLLMVRKIYLHAITMTRFLLPPAYLSISFVSTAFFSVLPPSILPFCFFLLMLKEYWVISGCEKLYYEQLFDNFFDFERFLLNVLWEFLLLCLIRINRHLN